MSTIVRDLTLQNMVDWLEKVEQAETAALLRSLQPRWDERVQVGNSLFSPVFTRPGVEDAYKDDFVRVEWSRALLWSPSIPPQTFRMAFYPHHSPPLTGMIVGMEKAPAALESLLLQLVGEG